MNYLLDTCSFIWLINGSNRLSQSLQTIFKDSENILYLSIASVWEIGIKYPLKKIEFVEDPSTFIPEQRKKHNIELLSLSEESCLYTTKLPLLHQDPFDRVLIAQAMMHNLVLVTPDKLIHQYPVKYFWK